MLSRPAAVVNRRCPASVLRWASLIIFARARNPSLVRASDHDSVGGLLLVLRGRTRLEEAFEEIATQVLRFDLSCLFPGHGGLGSEKQLGDVGESDGVAAGDAFAGELFDEIAEEEIHLVGGCEAVNVAKKFGSENFRVDSGNTRSETVCVVGAKHRARGSVRGTMNLVDQHVAAIAFRADVLAMEVDGSACRSAGFG